MIGIINCYHFRADNLFLRLNMRKGRPTKKKKRNISGLKNQNASLIPSYDSSPRSTSPAPQPIVPDSTRTNWEEEDVAPLDSDYDDQMELDIIFFQYWGWCKYRYREADKKTFQDAKNAALLYLNACPAEVIRRFINRSWRFMSAYRLGLTGRAAEWAVRKQKQHRSVSRAAMMALESILVH